MKMIGSDFDGTLFINNKVSAEDAAAIKEWQKKGHLFGVVTGRNRVMIKEKLSHCDIQLDFIIENNGARLIKHWSIGLDTAVFKQLFFLSAVGKEINAYIFTEEEAIKVPPLTHNEKIAFYQNLAKKKVLQFSLMFSSEEQAGKYLEGSALLKMAKINVLPNKTAIDIVTKKVGKAVGVGSLAERKQVSPTDITVVGDADNDLDMLTRYNGYAMKNSSPLVAKTIFKKTDSISQLISELLAKELK